MTRAGLFALVVLLAPSPSLAQQLRRPVACDACIAGWYYFDHGAGTAEQDWNCGGSTYDGHRGSDFSLRGGNGAIANGNDLVAAADGDVVSVMDGFFDRCTACGGANCGTGFGFGYGNHVVINHGNRRVVYAHMRMGSVRVQANQRVTCGQVIGQIASSGCSTGAHVHFEPRPLGMSSSAAYDPFQGSCSAVTSAWTAQGPYRGMPEPACVGQPTCPAGTFPLWNCEGNNARRRCVNGVDMREDCRWGCEVKPVGVDDVCSPPPDADADGAAADVDCNDRDPQIRPGAPEPCGDGVDQDCSGADAMCPTFDAGPSPSDAGSAVQFDATLSDAGPRPGDAASRTDSGELRSLQGGCTCTTAASTTSAPLGLSALTLLVVAWRRRRH